ncbi:MAG: DUF983 domain-containing protein [Planctomycetaceae bacterium]
MNHATIGVVLKRVIRLRCPRCGGGKQFLGYFAMHAKCSQCRLTYERAPGYFLGSAYINYGLTTLLSTIAYVVMAFGLGWSNGELVVPLLAFVVLFPLAFFRYSRSLWLGIDCWFDPTGFESDDPAS